MTFAKIILAFLVALAVFGSGILVGQKGAINWAGDTLLYGYKSGVVDGQRAGTSQAILQIANEVRTKGAASLTVDGTQLVLIEQKND